MLLRGPAWLPALRCAGEYQRWSKEQLAYYRRLLLLEDQVLNLILGKARRAA